MISPQGVAVATLLILGVVHGNLIDDMKAKFAKQSSGFGSFGSFGSFGKIGGTGSLPEEYSFLFLIFSQILRR